MASTFSASSKYHKLKGIYIYYRTAIYIAVAPVDLDCYQHELWAQEKIWLPLQKDRCYTYDKGQKNKSTLWIVFIPNWNSLSQSCYTEGRLSAPYSSMLYSFNRIRLRKRYQQVILKAYSYRQGICLQPDK